MNTFDINNLQGEYLTGFVADDGVLVSPIARLSFHSLFKKKVYVPPNGVPDPKAIPKFEATFLFNIGGYGTLGYVNLNPVVWPHLQKTAADFFAAAGKPYPYDKEDGFYALYDGMRHASKAGYGQGVLYTSARNGSEKLTSIPCINAQKQQIGPTDIKNGDFVRARLRAYVSNKYANKGVNLELKSVQLIMPWEAFSAEKNDTGDEMGAVPVPVQAPMPSSMPGSGYGQSYGQPGQQQAYSPTPGQPTQQGYGQPGQQQVYSPLPGESQNKPRGW